MTTEQQGASGAFQCKVCGDAARYSYFGAMACESCKMFFKRNAGSPQVKPESEKKKRFSFDGSSFRKP